MIRYESIKNPSEGSIPKVYNDLFRISFKFRRSGGSKVVFEVANSDTGHKEVVSFFDLIWLGRTNSFSELSMVLFRLHS